MILTDGFEKLGQALIVEFQLKLLVEAIEHLGVDAAPQGRLVFSLLMLAILSHVPMVHREDNHRLRLRK